MKFVVLFLLCASFSLFAQSEQTTSTQSAPANFYQRLKEGPVHFDLLSGVESLKNDTNDYNGFSSFHLATLSGALGPADSLAFTAYYLTDDYKDGTKAREWYRAYLTYTHKFLRQADVGFDLKGEMYYRYYPSAKRRNESGNNGMIRPAVSIGRSFDNGLYLSSKLHYAFNHAKSGRTDDPDRSTGYIYLITTESYSFTDKLSLSFIQEWAHYYENGNDEEGGDMIGTMELGYQMYEQIYAGIYTTGYMLLEDDGQFMMQDWQKKLTYGFNMNFSIF